MKLTVVGLTGRAGSGKDTVAGALIEGRGYQKVAFADPLYRIMKLEVAKQRGDAAAPYELFRLVLDLFGGPLKAPPLPVVTNVVMNDLTKIGEDTGLMRDYNAGTKPRKFLQYVGTELFRAYDPDTWVNYFNSHVVSEVIKLREEYFTALETSETLIRSAGKDEVAASEGSQIPEPHLRIVVTDCRFDNEGEAFERLVTMVNEIGPDVSASKKLIKLDLSLEEGARRVSARDDITLDAVLANMGHASEGGVSSTYIDAVVDAEQPIEKVCKDVFDVIDGKKQSSLLILADNGGPVPTAPVVPETGLTDLSKFKRGA